jgi:hypothetical protein
VVSMPSRNLCTEIISISMFEKYNDVELHKIEQRRKIKNCIERTLDSKANVNLSFRQILSPT